MTALHKVNLDLEKINIILDNAKPVHKCCSGRTYTSQISTNSTPYFKINLKDILELTLRIFKETPVTAANVSQFDRIYTSITNLRLATNLPQNCIMRFVIRIHVFFENLIFSYKKEFRALREELDAKIVENQKNVLLALARDSELKTKTENQQKLKEDQPVSTTKAVLISKKAFVIFLDIDGVLDKDENPDGMRQKYEELFPGRQVRVSRECTIAQAHFLNKAAVQNLDNLIETIEKIAEVRIVISSSWREGFTTEELRNNVFGMHKFSKYIVGKTPDKYAPSYNEMASNYSYRVAEIQSWIDDNPKVQNFVILDDQDSNFTKKFGKRFYKTEYRPLLTEEICQKIIADNFAANATV